MRFADSAQDISDRPRFGSRYIQVEEDDDHVDHELNYLQEPDQVPEQIMETKFSEELFQAQSGQEGATADRLIPFRSRAACEFTLAYAARRQEAVNNLNSAANSVSTKTHLMLFVFVCASILSSCCTTRILTLL